MVSVKFAIPESKAVIGYFRRGFKILKENNSIDSYKELKINDFDYGDDLRVPLELENNNKKTKIIIDVMDFIHIKKKYFNNIDYYFKLQYNKDYIKKNCSNY